jgi:AraC-like DNA-binding protein/ligand-binding sensor protein
MPQIIRHALASRIQNLPALRQLLDDLSEAAGLPVYFVPQSSAEGDLNETSELSLCTRLRADAAGCQLCRSFRHKLRDTAVDRPAVGTCDAGLWEALVPVRIGGQTVGHLLLRGCAETEPTPADHNRARHLLSRAGVTIEAPLLASLRAQSPVVAPRRRDALVRILQLAADRLALTLTEHLVTAPAALPTVVAHACNLVHAEFASPLRLSEFAARLDVSEGHFSRIFHHATGLRFVEYLARYRAERARMLILGSDQPIADIARACGFQSLSQFNRVFRAVYQTTPRILRSTAAA